MPDSYGLHKDAGMDTVLKSLEAELNKTARMHDNFGSRLESTVSAALKDSSRAGEAAYKSHEPHANTTAKDLEDAQARLTKVRDPSTPPRSPLAPFSECASVTGTGKINF